MTTPNRLNELKQELLALRVHRQHIKDVPEPQVVSVFRNQQQRNKRRKRIGQATHEIARLEKAVVQTGEDIHREGRAYEEHSEVLKDKVYILKAFIKNLQQQYEQVRKEFVEVEFLKTITAAIRRSYLYRLAEVFLNDQTRQIYRNSLYLAIRANSELKFPYQEVFNAQLEDEIAICLSYMSLMIDMIARVINITLLNPINFKGTRSFVRSADKLDSHPLFITKSGDRKLFEQGLKICMANAAQLLDVIGVDRRIKRQQDILSMFDVLSQYIIATEVDELRLPA